MKKIIRISEQKINESSGDYWITKTPQERIEAVEILREHYYIMLGYTETPRIMKKIEFSPIRPR